MSHEEALTAQDLLQLSTALVPLGSTRQAPAAAIAPELMEYANNRMTRCVPASQADQT